MVLRYLLRREVLMHCLSGDRDSIEPTIESLPPDGARPIVLFSGAGILRRAALKHPSIHNQTPIPDGDRVSAYGHDSLHVANSLI